MDKKKLHFALEGINVSKEIRIVLNISLQVFLIMKGNYDLVYIELCYCLDTNLSNETRHLNIIDAEEQLILLILHLLKKV